MKRVTTKYLKGVFKSIFLTIPGSIIVASLLISFSILLSSGVIKIKGLNPNPSLVQAPKTDQALTQQAPQAAALDNSGPVKVSIDNDPVMGDKNAKVTLIEFADFECPFCKRSFEDVIPQLKKEYIDKGKVKFVYRDLPLDFHQNAHKEAQAAECAREQGGDATYFKYHDEIYKRTTSNGTGLALDKLPVIAKELGLNVGDFQQCLDTGKYKTEVDKDIADAQKAGASGTPTWFIGKTTTDGIIEGTKIVGAQPYNVFKTIIDQQLK